MNGEFAEREMKAQIRVEYKLADPPKKVWHVLTDSDLLATWLMPNDFCAEVGHRFTFRAQPTPGWDGVVYCEVLEIVPEQRLVYRWRGGAHELTGYGEQLDTVVTWTLTPAAEGGTTLVLEHAGFEQESFALKAMGMGWRGKIATRMHEVMAALE